MLLFCTCHPITPEHAGIEESPDEGMGGNGNSPDSQRARGVEWMQVRIIVVGHLREARE
jgi:hypothetical protein